MFNIIGDSTIVKWLYTCIILFIFYFFIFIILCIYSIGEVITCPIFRQNCHELFVLSIRLISIRLGIKVVRVYWSMCELLGNSLFSCRILWLRWRNNLFLLYLFIIVYDNLYSTWSHRQATFQILSQILIIFHDLYYSFFL